MKRKLTLIQIFWIFLFLCSFTQAQQSDDTLIHSDSKIREPLSIKLQRSRRLPHPLMTGEPFTFPLQLSSEKITIPMRFGYKTSALWINSNIYAEKKGSPFECSESKSCQGEEPQEFAWERENKKETAVLVKEQVNFGGESTFANFDVFMAIPENFSWDGQKEIEGSSASGMLGLAFRQRANPKVPTIYERFQEPILSISLKNNYEGELIFGGYPNNKTKVDFKFLKLIGFPESESEFSVVAKSVYQLPLRDLSDRAFVRGGARLDFDSPVLSIPHDAYYRIRDFVWKHRLGIKDSNGIGMFYANGLQTIKCSEKERMRDLFIEFEGLTLNIPASAYIISARDYNFENDFYEGERVPLDEKCAVALVGNSGTLLGQPFFKCYDVVIDSKTNSVGFSPKYIPDPAPFLANSRIRHSIFGICGIVCLVAFGFFLQFMFQKYAKLKVEKGKLDESAASASFPSQEEVVEPVESLDYPLGYVNLPSGEQVGEI